MISIHRQSILTPTLFEQMPKERDKNVNTNWCFSTLFVVVVFNFSMTLEYLITTSIGIVRSSPCFFPSLSLIFRYAKGSPNDNLIKVVITNQADHDAELHFLPTLWYRNTWAFGSEHEDDNLRKEIRIGELVLLFSLLKSRRISSVATPDSKWHGKLLFSVRCLRQLEQRQVHLSSRVDIY